MQLWKKHKKRIFFLVGTFVLFCGCFLLKNDSTYSTAKIQIKSVSYTVLVADTPAKRTQGLSNTHTIPHDGMIFVFGVPGMYSFWMKDMHYPLDFIWLDEHKRVVDLDVNVSPESYPHKIVPEVPVSYVLEVPAHFIETHEIKIGDLVSF